MDLGQTNHGDDMMTLGLDDVDDVVGSRVSAPPTLPPYFYASAYFLTVHDVQYSTASNAPCIMRQDDARDSHRATVFGDRVVRLSRNDVCPCASLYVQKLMQCLWYPIPRIF